MPQCCKTIHIDGSSQNYNQYDFVCSYSHDYHEYNAYTCKGDPNNNWAWWINAREGGIGFYKLPHYGDRYLLGSPALTPGEELRPVFNKGFFPVSQSQMKTFSSGGLAFWAWQSPNESKGKQNLMKCPDLSIPITFHSGIGIVVNATCAEYFEPIDPCSGISCKENASCITKENSYECSCNDGFTNINNSTDTSGKLEN